MLKEGENTETHGENEQQSEEILEPSIAESSNEDRRLSTSLPSMRDIQIPQEQERNKEISENETWKTFNDNSKPEFLDQYTIYESYAIKEKSKGRASGELAILVKKLIRK
ncbi:hypothetical protein CBL_10653 [Carabus blaptoides fortunei]